MGVSFDSVLHVGAGVRTYELPFDCPSCLTMNRITMYCDILVPGLDARLDVCSCSACGWKQEFQTGQREIMERGGA